MTFPTKFAVPVLSLLVAGCATTGQTGAGPLASGEIRTGAGLAIGQVQMRRTGAGLELAVQVSGLSAGIHGMHIHETGRCEGPGFQSAGSHLNPGGKKHGLNNPAGRHLGDLPNLEIDGQGQGNLKVLLPGDAQGNAAAILDADGSAIVIHASADDYLTDPTGNSGGRMACGVLTPMP